MKKIKVICTEFNSEFGVNRIDVDSRMYNEDESKIIYPDEVGEEYHLGQVSSSFSWAFFDITNHFKKELNELFPEAKNEFEFEFFKVQL